MCPLDCLSKAALVHHLVSSPPPCPKFHTSIQEPGLSQIRNRSYSALTEILVSQDSRLLQEI